MLLFCYVTPLISIFYSIDSFCWETTVGQELFKLTIIDLVALVFSVVTGDLFVSLTVRFLNCFQGRLMDLEKLVSLLISIFGNNLNSEKKKKKSKESTNLCVVTYSSLRY